MNLRRQDADGADAMADWFESRMHKIFHKTENVPEIYYDLRRSRFLLFTKWHEMKLSIILIAIQRKWSQAKLGSQSTEV